MFLLSFKIIKREDFNCVSNIDFFLLLSFSLVTKHEKYIFLLFSLHLAFHIPFSVQAFKTSYRDKKFREQFRNNLMKQK